MPSLVHRSKWPSQRNELLDVGLAPVGDPQVERAGEMQRFEVAHPGVGDLIVGPFAGDENGDLVVCPDNVLLDRDDAVVVTADARCPDRRRRHRRDQ